MSLSARSDGELEKRTANGKEACFCDHHETWSHNSQHDDATFEAKKKVNIKQGATLKANLAALLMTSYDDDIFYFINTGITSHSASELPNQDDSIIDSNDES